MRVIPRNSPLKTGILIILLMWIPILLSAQDEPSEEIDWENYKYDVYAPGDQSLTISLGVVFPVLFVNNGNIIEKKTVEKPDGGTVSYLAGYFVVGGTGSFAYNYYLTPHLYVGGEVGGMFVPTIAEHTLFTIYLGGRVGTQFIAWRFEFPISASLGMTWHTYLDNGHYSMYLKGSVGAFFRATPSWAFGLTTNWFFFPEWTYENTGTPDNVKNVRTPHKDVYGNFIDLTISARYQF